MESIVCCNALSSSFVPPQELQRRIISAGRAAEFVSCRGRRIAARTRCSAEVADTERRTRKSRGNVFDNDKGRPSVPPKKPREMSRSERLDTFGRLRTPRAAREMALCVMYAAMVRDEDALKVYEERLNQRIGRDFDRGLLESYDHKPVDVGDNETEEDEAKAVELVQQQEEEADAEGTILMAPLPLVYSRFVLSLVRNLVKTTGERWSSQEKIIKAAFPRKWRNEPEIAWLPLCILQIALTEIETMNTSPRVVINEAIDLTRRFCDGAAPRIVHAILSKYMENRESEQKAASPSAESTGDVQ